MSNNNNNTTAGVETNQWLECVHCNTKKGSARARTQFAKLVLCNKCYNHHQKVDDAMSYERAYPNTN